MRLFEQESAHIIQRAIKPYAIVIIDPYLGEEEESDIIKDFKANYYPLDSQYIKDFLSEASKNLKEEEKVVVSSNPADWKVEKINSNLIEGAGKFTTLAKDNFKIEIWFYMIDAVTNNDIADIKQFLK